MSAWGRVRSVADRVAALCLAVLLAPLLLLIGVLVRVIDGAPVLVRLPRVGRDGSVFDMWKFRTMSAKGDDGLAAGLRITSGADPRITPFGRRLRHQRLDELAQLRNVVSGEMALIGPRPETPELVDRDDARWKEVLSLRPGVAGLTQLLVADLEEEALTDRHDASEFYEREILPLKLDLDRFYIKRQGPRLDIAVAFDLIARITLNQPARWSQRLVERHDPSLATRLGALKSSMARDRYS